MQTLCMKGKWYQAMECHVMLLKSIWYVFYYQFLVPITITLKSNVCERHLQARRIFTEGTKQYNTLGSCREQWEQFVYKIFGASIDYSQSSAPSSQSSVIKQLVKGVHCIMPLLTSSVPSSSSFISLKTYNVTWITEFM